MNISFRAATVADIPAIQNIAETTFPATYKNIITPEQIEYMMEWMYSTPNLKQQMEVDNHIYHLLSADEKYVGYVSVQSLGTGLWELQKIYLLPTMQGKGLGRILMENALKAILKYNGSACQVHLRVNRNNKAVGFYKKMGFEILKEDDAHIGNNFWMNDYIMSISLNKI